MVERLFFFTTYLFQVFLTNLTFAIDFAIILVIFAFM